MTSVPSRFLSLRFWGTLLLFVTIALSFSGCATDDDDYTSERPWAAPQGWEHGMPSQMYQQR